MTTVPGGFVDLAYVRPSKGLPRKCLEARVVLVPIVDGTVFLPNLSALKSLA